MAQAIVSNIEADNDAIDHIELSQAGKGDPAKSGFFMNIYLKPQFMQEQIRAVYMTPSLRLQEAIDIENAA